MEEFEKRSDDARPRDDAPAEAPRSDAGPSEPRPSDASASDAGPADRPFSPGPGPAGADDFARRRRRGRRGRGGGQRFGAPPGRGPMPPRPFGQRGPMA